MCDKWAWLVVQMQKCCTWMHYSLLKGKVSLYVGWMYASATFYEHKAGLWRWQDMIRMNKEWTAVKYETIWNLDHCLTSLVSTALVSKDVARYERRQCAEMMSSAASRFWPGICAFEAGECSSKFCSTNHAFRAIFLTHIVLFLWAIKPHSRWRQTLSSLQTLSNLSFAICVQISL